MAQELDRSPHIFFNRWTHVEGSMSAAAGGRQTPSPVRESVFDSWLAARRRRRDAVTATLRAEVPTALQQRVTMRLATRIESVTPAQAAELAAELAEGVRIEQVLESELIELHALLRDEFDIELEYRITEGHTP